MSGDPKEGAKEEPYVFLGDSLPLGVDLNVASLLRAVQLHHQLVRLHLQVR